MPEGLEIERKFLLGPDAPDLSGVPVTDVCQGYLTIAEQDEVRVRDAGGRFTLTVKSGHGLVRQEHEIALTAEQFGALWPATESRRVEKRRFKLACSGLTCEIDIYAGALDGLATVEIEFADTHQANGFVPFEWLGREVTAVPGYTNAELATQGLPDDKAS